MPNSQISASGLSSWTRQLWPGEEELLVRHLLRLGPEDLHSRFMGFAGEATIRAHIARARKGNWRVIGWFHRGTLSAAVELAIDGTRAEAALTTEAPYRRHGVGRQLLEKAIRAAAAAGATELYLVTSPSNAAMVSLARAAGASFRQEEDTLIGHASLTSPDAARLCRDLLEDGRGQVASAAAQTFPVATGMLSSALDHPA